MDTEPLANLIFNSRARNQFFGNASFIHIYANRDLILLRGYNTDKSPDSTPYELVRYRGGRVAVSLTPNHESAEILRALFRNGLSEDRTFFRLAKAPGERGWLGIENLNRPPLRQEAIMQVTEFIEQPELRDFDMDEWSTLLRNVTSGEYQMPQIERFASYVLSAHRMLQFEDRRGVPSGRRTARVRRAESVMKQFHENLPAIANGIASNSEAVEKLDRLCVTITEQPPPHPKNGNDEPTPARQDVEVGAPIPPTESENKSLPAGNFASEEVAPGDWVKEAAEDDPDSEAQPPGEDQQKA